MVIRIYCDYYLEDNTYLYLLYTDEILILL